MTYNLMIKPSLVYLDMVKKSIAIYIRRGNRKEDKYRFSFDTRDQITPSLVERLRTRPEEFVIQTQGAT